MASFLKHPQPNTLLNKAYISIKFDLATIYNKPN